MLNPCCIPHNLLTTNYLLTLVGSRRDTLSRSFGLSISCSPTLSFERPFPLKSGRPLARITGERIHSQRAGLLRSGNISVGECMDTGSSGYSAVSHSSSHVYELPPPLAGWRRYLPFVSPGFEIRSSCWCSRHLGIITAAVPLSVPQRAMPRRLYCGGQGASKSASRCLTVGP